MRRLPWYSTPLLLIPLLAGACTADDAGSTPSADAGASVAPPGNSHEPDAAAKAAPGQVLFGALEPLHLELTLSAADWTELEEHGNREEYVPAAARISRNQQEVAAFAEVGLRYKGSWSLHHCWDMFGGVRSREAECSKLSLKVKFDEYDASGRLDGLKRINLHAGQLNPTKLRELLGYQAFRDFGIAAPRVLPAQVIVNGTNLGLYLAVEEVDGRFTKAHFSSGDGDGNLYKEVWPSPLLEPQDALEALETNEELADSSDFLAFAGAVAAATEQSFDAVVGAHTDIDALLRYVVVDRAIKNWDGIMAFYSPEAPHNFYWYRDAGGSEKFHLVPWDLDNAFERDWLTDPEFSFGVQPLPNWNMQPLNCDERALWDPSGEVTATPPRCDKLLDLLARTHWADFDALARTFLASHFSSAKLQAQVDQWVPLLTAIVQNDPAMDLAEWQDAVRVFRDNTLPQMVADFEAFLAQGLISEPEPGSAEVPPPPAVVVSANAGFSATALNDFEFATEGGAAEGVATWDDGLSTVSVTLNTVETISGAGDLMLSCTFLKTEGPYNEYVGVGYYGDSADVSAKESLVLSLRAVPARTVRLALASPVFDNEFGGAWPEFNVNLSVTEEPKQFVIPLRAFSYAAWAKEAWTAGQGWTTSDDEALTLALQNFNGLIFNPIADQDAAGELEAAQDVGTVWVDQIYVH